MQKRQACLCLEFSICQFEYSLNILTFKQPSILQDYFQILVLIDKVAVM